MFKNIFQNIKLVAQINSMNSRQASSVTNYGDYVKFLELVGNCKVSKTFSGTRRRKITHCVTSKKGKENERALFTVIV